MTIPATLPADSLADTAVAYALLGWRIFPVVPGGKVPQFKRAHTDDAAQAACPGGHACGRMGHGFRDATADAARVAAWWARNPRCNVGIATGNPHGVDIGQAGHSPDVLDVDVKDGAPGLTTIRRLLDAALALGSFASVSTPSGGWHLYFGGTGQSSATLKKHGIDFRACGGYVVGAGGWLGTARNPRPYRLERLDLAKERTVSWADIRDFLTPPPPPRAFGPPALADNATPIVEWFAGQSKGSRNDSLFWAACRILESGYPPDRLDELRSEGLRSGLGDAEVRKTLDSAARRILGGADGRT